VNSQNNWYWSAENPRLIHRLLLCDEKVGVWCVISAHRVIGPMFYDNVLSAARYVNNVLHPFFAKLTEEESYVVFSSKILQHLVWHMQLWKHCGIVFW
jgi:hypothetical protein